MKIVFVDEGESNRALMAMSLYMHISKSIKKKTLPKAFVATIGKNKSLHMKGLKALKEFGLCVGPCSKKLVKTLEDIKIAEKTRVIVLGQDNKPSTKKIVNSKNIECWPIDNPMVECKNEVKLRFFRRVRDQLWVNIENLVSDVSK